VYWVAPVRAGELAPAIDRWLAANEPRIDALRARWFGSAAQRDGVDHIADLLARRIALMPAVAAWKRARGTPLEDAAREVEVVDRAAARARSLGLDPAGVAELFRVQIALAKDVQARAPAAAPTLDLATQLRPLLGSLGDAIVDALTELRPPLDRSRLLAALSIVEEIDASERARLADALLAIPLSSKTKPQLQLRLSNPR
jgi:chorismate mutase